MGDQHQVFTRTTVFRCSVLTALEGVYVPLRFWVLARAALRPSWAGRGGAGRYRYPDSRLGYVHVIASDDLGRRFNLTY